MGKSVWAPGSSVFPQISSFCSFCGGNRIFKYSSQASGDFDFICILLKESMLPKGQGGEDIKATCLRGVWHARHTGVLQPEAACLPSFLCPFIVPGKTWGVWLWTGTSGEAGRALSMQGPGPNPQNQTLHSKEIKLTTRANKVLFFFRVALFLVRILLVYVFFPLSYLFPPWLLLSYLFKKLTYKYYIHLWGTIWCFFFLFRFTVLFLFMLCVHNHLGVPRSQKTAADPLGLELQGVMSNLM